MKLLKKTTLALAFAAGTLAAGSASADQICLGCAYLSAGGPAASYIGSYSPTNGDSGTFTHGGLGTGAFNDWWIFDVNPAGTGEWQAIFTVSAGVSNFSATMYESTGAVCLPVSGDADPDPVNVIPNTSGFCSALGSGNTGAVVGTNTPGNNSLNLLNLSLRAGQFAVNVTGNSTASVTGGQTRFNSYSGNLAVSAVPEPGSLALVALALLGAGVAVRRRA